MEKPTSIWRYRFQIAALCFGINRAEGQGGLARSGYAGKDNQGVAWKVHIYVAKVVLSRPADANDPIRLVEFSNHAQNL
jgi:hypothetical protein